MWCHGKCMEDVSVAIEDHACQSSVFERAASRLAPVLSRSSPLSQNPRDTHVLNRRLRPRRHRSSPPQCHCQLPSNTPSPARAASRSTRRPHCPTSTKLQRILNALHARWSDPVGERCRTHNFSNAFEGTPSWASGEYPWLCRLDRDVAYPTSGFIHRISYNCGEGAEVLKRH